MQLYKGWFRSSLNDLDVKRFKDIKKNLYNGRLIYLLLFFIFSFLIFSIFLFISLQLYLIYLNTIVNIYVYIDNPFIPNQNNNAGNFGQWQGQYTGYGGNGSNPNDDELINQALLAQVYCNETQNPEYTQEYNTYYGQNANVQQVGYPAHDFNTNYNNTPMNVNYNTESNLSEHSQLSVSGMNTTDPSKLQSNYYSEYNNQLQSNLQQSNYYNQHYNQQLSTSQQNNYNVGYNSNSNYNLGYNRNENLQEISRLDNTNYQQISSHGNTNYQQYHGNINYNQHIGSYNIQEQTGNNIIQQQTEFTNYKQHTGNINYQQHGLNTNTNQLPVNSNTHQYSVNSNVQQHPAYSGNENLQQINNPVNNTYQNTVAQVQTENTKIGFNNNAGYYHNLQSGNNNYIQDNRITYQDNNLQDLPQNMANDTNYSSDDSLSPGMQNQNSTDQSLMGINKNTVSTEKGTDTVTSSNSVQKSSTTNQAYDSRPGIELNYDKTLIKKQRNMIPGTKRLEPIYRYKPLNPPMERPKTPTMRVDSSVVERHSILQMNQGRTELYGQNPAFYTENNLPTHFKGINHSCYPIRSNNPDNVYSPTDMLNYWNERKISHENFISRYLDKSFQQHNANVTSGVVDNTVTDRLTNNPDMLLAKQYMQNTPTTDVHSLGTWIENKVNILGKAKVRAKDIGLDHYNGTAPENIKNLFSNYVKIHPKYFGSNSYGNVKLDNTFIEELKEYIKKS